MSRKVRRVPVRIDPQGIDELSFADQRAILRGADDLIGTGGRSLLVKILRGSRMKKVLELGLDESPVHGHFRELSDDEVLARVDWMIANGLLAIEYDFRLPILVYTPRGWEIERETCAAELLESFDDVLRAGPPFDMTWLRDRQRDLILLLLDKVQATGEAKYIPLLQAWQEVDYKKVRQRIGQVIRQLEQAP
jgi:hypothetical protein